MLISPQSEYAMAGAWAMGRAMDDAIIAAATGTVSYTHLTLPTNREV